MIERGDGPRRVAVVGDWHGNAAWATHAIAAAERSGAETILHVGDFGLWPGLGGVKFLDAVQEAAAAAQVEVLWIDGNHDDHTALDTWPVEADQTQHIRPGVRHLPRGFRWSWHGKIWLALGGAISIDRSFRTEGVDWWPGEAISDDDVARAIDGGPADVMVTHDAPTRVPTLDEWLGRPGTSLTREIQADADRSRQAVGAVVDAVRPELLLHGHYHRRYHDVRDGRTRIEGLDCDGGSMARNIVLVEPLTLQVRSLYST